MRMFLETWDSHTTRTSQAQRRSPWRFSYIYVHHSNSVAWVKRMLAVKPRTVDLKGRLIQSDPRIRRGLNMRRINATTTPRLFEMIGRQRGATRES